MVNGKYNKEFSPEELFLSDPDACYEKAETDLLRNALKKSYTERFLMATKLYKISMMLKNAKVTHQPFIPKQ
jgi:hypothetical protein